MVALCVLVLKHLRPASIFASAAATWPSCGCGLVVGGVCASVVPTNFPLTLATSSLALAACCCSCFGTTFFLTSGATYYFGELDMGAAAGWTVLCFLGLPGLGFYWVFRLLDSTAGWGSGWGSGSDSGWGVSRGA